MQRWSRSSLASGAILLLLLLAPGLLPGASAAVGSGSTLRVETQTQMLFREGGGYITWELSGPAVVELRRCIDDHLGDGDGKVTQIEGVAYTSEIESILENYKSYGSARIVRVALLTKDINADTQNLLTSVNSSAPVTIHFYFNANLRAEGATVNFGDTTIPYALFQALPDEANRSFAGSLDWSHREILVGVASFSGLMRGQGEFTRLRAPGAEVIFYHLSLTGGRSSFDEARFDTFNPVQCSLELFIVICVFGFVTIYMPRRYMRESGMRKVRWLHWLALLLLLVLLLVYVFGADGLVVWALSPVFMILSWVLSHQIYVRRWRGIAKPLAPAGQIIPGLPTPGVVPGPAPGEPLAYEPYQGEPAPPRTWEPPPPPEFPAGPAPPPQPPPPSTPPAAAGARRNSVRCPKCGRVVDFLDNGTRPLPLICPDCGAKLMLKI